MSGETLWRAECLTDADAAPAIAEAFENAFAPEALAVSLFEISEQTRLWRVEALYSEAVTAAALENVLATAGLAAPEGGITVGELAQENWVAKSLEGLKPVLAGRFFVHGAHDAALRPPGAIPVQVEAGMAFGTGHHGTTLGCLLAIEAIARARHIRNPLDLGCGTGVLAIALAKRLGRPVLASDIDPIAVAVTRANARANHVPALIGAVTAPGFRGPALKARAPYDLIVANILARPLMQLAPDFRAHLAPGGRLVLSGLLASQEQMVTSALRAQGLYLTDRLHLGGWATLILSNRTVAARPGLAYISRHVPDL